MRKYAPSVPLVFNGLAHQSSKLVVGVQIPYGTPFASLAQ